MAMSLARPKPLRKCPTTPDIEERATVSTQRERAEKRREEKLAAIEQQVRDGSLVIRKMTAAERAKYPKPATPRRSRRRP
jgi:hypothetical protein